MKRLSVTMLVLASALWLFVGCASLKREFTSPPNTTNAPPISSQLNAVAPVIGAVVPQPWGTLIAGLLATVSTGLAAIAANHAKKTVTASAAAAAAVDTPPPKTG